MGFRFRKSINLGGGVRINLSKSGIGYSFGVPGLRYTKSANGRTRKTYSIPGTGLSYVDEGSYTVTINKAGYEPFVMENLIVKAEDVISLEDIKAAVINAMQAPVEPEIELPQEETSTELPAEEPEQKAVQSTDSDDSDLIPDDVMSLLED